MKKTEPYDFSWYTFDDLLNLAFSDEQKDNKTLLALNRELAVRCQNLMTELQHLNR